jgi:HEAT repeat protein
MRWSPVILAVCVGASARGSTELTQQVQNVLSTMDIVPTEVEIDTAFNDHAQALAGLVTIVADVGTDVGIQLRAIHALSKYCAAPQCVDSDVAHQTLVSVITANYDPNVSTGSSVVILRAAVEAIGPQRVGTDLPLLAPMLGHTSRDIRAATAHALRDLCNTEAIAPLRIQQQNETSDQVRQAITEALRILGQPQPCQ